MLKNLMLMVMGKIGIISNFINEASDEYVNALFYATLFDTILSIIGVFLFAFIFRKIYKYVKKSEENNEFNSDSAVDAIKCTTSIISLIISALIILISFINILVTSSKLVKMQLSPKVYKIEYIKSLTK